MLRGKKISNYLTDPKLLNSSVCFAAAADVLALSLHCFMQSVTEYLSMSVYFSNV